MKFRVATRLVFLLFFLAFIALCPFDRTVAPLALTQDAGKPQGSTIQLDGLRDRVMVRRDQRGIPYIEAKSDEDLYFAQGYVTASDRLWQMDLFRRTERGELAEVLGAGPNNIALEQDKQHRTLGFARVAEAEVALASPQARGLLEAYARGVNAYIASLDGPSLPPEFQILQYKPKPWTPADSLLVVKLFFEALSSTWRLDIMREAMAGLPAAKREMLLPEFSPLDVLVVGKDTRRKNITACAGKRGPSIPNRVTYAHWHMTNKLQTHALARVGLYAEEPGCQQQLGCQRQTDHHR